MPQQQNRNPRRELAVACAVELRTIISLMDHLADQLGDLNLDTREQFPFLAEASDELSSLCVCADSTNVKLSKLREQILALNL